MAEPPEPATAPIDEAAEQALARISSERVHEVLAKLSEDQRAVVLLRIIGDLSLEQVAEALGQADRRDQAAAAPRPPGRPTRNSSARG